MSSTLLLFALTNLVVGTGAFMIGGLVAGISADLGVSLGAAGQAMTAYAAATALLAPVLLVMTSGWPRKRAIALALTLCGIGNLVCAGAGALPMLLAGRVLMGMGSMYLALSAALAVAQADVAQRGRALAIVYLGISLSFVLGLPLGTYLATTGSWRTPVLIMGVACFGCLALLMWLIPSRADAAGPGFAGVGVLLRRGDVQRTFVLTLLYATAVFNVFSYIAPVLQSLGPMSATTVSLVMACTGLAGVAGTLAGGWAADRFGPLAALRAELLLFIAAMLVLPFTAGHTLATLVAFMLWCATGFSLMPGQQARLAQVSDTQTPLLLSLNSSMMNLGTAAGAALGGLAGGWLGLAHLVWAGVPFALLGLLTLGLRPASR